MVYVVTHFFKVQVHSIVRNTNNGDTAVGDIFCTDTVFPQTLFSVMLGTIYFNCKISIMTIEIDDIIINHFLTKDSDGICF